ncbi:hypothetical protein L915_13648 [Phytophthora nicotianae]|uniref:Uncharacterized protein n=1 Tax=Phytophthora nicotianae TaxID=4792 RepID=W2GES9_PHYNI|nr:hypothetical protein L915_13648 [Phytophthora nicotianae]
MERKEIPVDAAALQRLNISDTTPATPSRDASKSPCSRDLPLTPRVTPVKNAPVTSAAEELEKKDQAFEEKDAVTV